MSQGLEKGSKDMGIRTGGGIGEQGNKQANEGQRNNFASHLNIADSTLAPALGDLEPSKIMTTSPFRRDALSNKVLASV